MKRLRIQIKRIMILITVVLLMLAAIVLLNTFRFIPIRVTQTDMNRIHGPNERISVNNYLDVIRFFIQQIRNSAA